MAERDFDVMPDASVKHFQHLMSKIKAHCGGIKKTARFIGIADSTYRKLMDEDAIVKSTAQKILNAYAQIAPYNQEKSTNAKAA